MICFVSVNGEWSTWTVQTACSVTCGGGSEVFTRSCDSPAPQHSGADCVGSSSKTEDCAVDECPGTSGIRNISHLKHTIPSLFFLPKDCSQVGFRYKQGNAGFVHNVYDWRTCQTECQNFPGCVYFVFSTANRATQPNTCALKSSSAIGPVATADVISGPPYC